VTAPSLVREIETAAYRCWPARDIEEHDGWELRFSDGFSRRANSVYPVRRSHIDWLEKLEWCLGLFEIIVDAKNRTLGVGTDLTQTLMGWGRGKGARKAFLQVGADNGPAIAMHEGLGFSVAHSYWYRRASRTSANT
jgi:ribosomal protein S18 acetylase RimI-like enzyme